MLCSHENENPDGTIQKLETKAAEQNTCNVFFLLFHSFKLDNCSGNKKNYSSNKTRVDQFVWPVLDLKHEILEEVS